MAKREYKLPNYGDLNKEQDKVLALPKDGQFLIVGGPGTGKSVVALLRASKSQDDKDYIFLTFNHVLNTATKQVVPFNLESDSCTRWLYRLQYCLTGKWMPETEDYKADYKKISNDFENFSSNNFQNINTNFPEKSNTRRDFHKWLMSLKGKNLTEKFENLHFIIDEAQDMPPGFYEALQSLGCKNFFIVADQNQQITEDNSSRQELTDVLALEAEDVIELKENFRQKGNLKIAELAQYFYTDISSPKPDLPTGISIDTAILYEYEWVNSCVEMILNEADRNNDKLIGLFVATDTKREDYVKKLNNMDILRDNEKPIIESYTSQEEQVNIDFSSTGIVVLCDKSVKGIEFDIVYIVLDGFNLSGDDYTNLKKRFYVMTSRAKEKLIILKSKIYSGKIDTIFPDDKSILIRDSI